MQSSDRGGCKTSSLYGFSIQLHVVLVISLPINNSRYKTSGLGMLQCTGRLQDQPGGGGVRVSAAGSPGTLADRLQPGTHGALEP